MTPFADLWADAVVFGFMGKRWAFARAYKVNNKIVVASFDGTHLWNRVFWRIYRRENESRQTKVST